VSPGNERPHQRNGKLSIPLPFEDAVKAALKVKPPEKPKRKRSAKTPKKPSAR
jgi:hypothetical protein